MSLGNVFISGVYSPITMKSGMKMGLWTLITGKLLWSGYLRNGCHGDQIAVSQLFNDLFWIWTRAQESWRRLENEISKHGFPWTQHVAIATKNKHDLASFGCLNHILWRLLLEVYLCYSVLNPVTRAPREGQGPSKLYANYGRQVYYVKIGE